MSCNCNSSTYSSSCCPEVPYPSISSESVPSLIDNLVYALYGTIEKSVSSGRVIWNIPCDPSATPAEVTGIPRQAGEGLLCYIIRVLNEDIVVIPNVVDTVSAQTLTGQKTFTQSIIASGGVTGSLTGAASLNVLKAGDTMTGPLVVPAGASGSQVPRANEVVLLTGAQAIAGSKTFSSPIIGSLNGNADTATAATSATLASQATTLQNARTIAISGAVTGTATSFNGSANISIPATISSGATITSPVFAGTATGAITSKVVQGVTDGSSAAAGYVGQLLSANTALTNIASNTVANGATITLTPGDWEVYGNATFNFSGVSCAAGDFLGAAISLTASVLPDGQRQIVLIPALTTITQSPAYSFVIPRVRFNVTVNTAVYLVVQAPTTTAGTMQYSSIISANRIR
jgi:hypothetical protein